MGTPATGRSIMTLIPYSKTTSSENIPISISNSSTVNIANLQSPVTPHVNLKGDAFEGGLSITAQSLPGTPASAVSNLTTAKPGVPPTIPVLLQQPLSLTNISSQTNHETQQLVTNAVATIPVPGNGEGMAHAISVHTPEAAQQHLIAAAMASLSTAIPSGTITTPQTMNQPNKAISAANGNSLYQVTN